MILYKKFKVEIEAIQQQLVKAKNKCTNAPKEANHFYKEFGLTIGMLKGLLAKRRLKK